MHPAPPLHGISRTAKAITAGAHASTATLVAMSLVVAAAGCATPASRRTLAPAPGLSQLAPADELYELSPARVHIRRLAPQALRLLAPHWSHMREGDRRIVQGTLVATLSEQRVAPFVRARISAAVEERPDLAAAALEWLRSPLGYDVKFSEATAWGGEKSLGNTFYSEVAEVRDNRTPEVRMDRVRRLSEAMLALEKTLDLTAAVGTVVARLVNRTTPDRPPLALAALEAAIDRERRKPEVLFAYEPVVRAALLVRCRDLDLDQLDRYIAFAASPGGRWYHDTMTSSLVGAVTAASADVEGVLAAHPHSDRVAGDTTGFDLDSLLVALPSGREVRLLALAQTGSPAQQAVVVRYETTLPLQNAAAIRSEVDEVWEKLHTQIESEGAHAVVLQPTGSVEGWVFPFALSRKFAWRRDETGQWKPAKAGELVASNSVEREMLWSVPP